MPDDWTTKELAFCRLKIQCSCGGEINENYDSIAITSDYAVLFTGICPKCKRRIAGKSSFEDLMRMCSALSAREGEFTEEDQKFLHDFHITKGEP